MTILEKGKSILTVQRDMPPARSMNV